MRVAALILLVLCGTARAQPGAAPQPQPYPPPPVYAPPPAPAYAIPLTREEYALLERGEITDGEHIGGGLASLLFGFGTGQAIQGRWSETGYIFTVGELVAGGVMIVGMVRIFDDCFDIRTETDKDCEHSDGPVLLTVGLVGAGVFRVWEIVDAFRGPGEHNRKVRELKFRLGVPMRIGDLKPYVNATRDGGATAGLSFRF